MRPSFHPRSSGRSHWTVVAFLFTFTLLLIASCHYFLFPALEAMKSATPKEKAGLRAWSSLVEAVLLFILLAGLDPFKAYQGLVQGALGSDAGLTRSLLKMAPFILSGLSAALPLV